MIVDNFSFLIELGSKMLYVVTYNRPAHLLAQYARLVGYVTRIEETPYMVESVVTHDIYIPYMEFPLSKLHNQQQA